MFPWDSFAFYSGIRPHSCPFPDCSGPVHSIPEAGTSPSGFLNTVTSTCFVADLITAASNVLVPSSPALPGLTSTPTENVSRKPFPSGDVCKSASSQIRILSPPRRFNQDCPRSLRSINMIQRHTTPQHIFNTTTEHTEAWIGTWNDVRRRIQGPIGWIDAVSGTNSRTHPVKLPKIQF